MAAELEDAKAIAQRIADQLGETEEAALGYLRRLVKHAGTEVAYQLLQQTQEVEANGGMLTLDGSRRRTPGGVYFYLAKGQIPIPTVWKIFTPPKPRGRKKKKLAAQAAAQQQQTPAEANSQEPEIVELPALPQDAPSEAVAQWEQLHTAATLLREKIAAMQGEGQQAGLGMTRKLLENTQRQLYELVQRYSQ